MEVKGKIYHIPHQGFFFEIDLIILLLLLRAHINHTYKGIFYQFFFAFSQDINDFYGNKRKAFDKLYFSKMSKLPFTHFSSSSSSKVETQVTQLKQVNRKQHSTTKQPLTKILIKKKILLQKLHFIQISDVTRTKPEHIINKKKIMT